MIILIVCASVMLASGVSHILINKDFPIVPTMIINCAIGLLSLGVGSTIAFKSGINLDPKIYTLVVTAEEPISIEK